MKARWLVYGGHRKRPSFGRVFSWKCVDIVWKCCYHLGMNPVALEENRDLHALLYADEAKMFQEIAGKWWKDNNRSGRINDSDVLRSMIRERHAREFPKKK